MVIWYWIYDLGHVNVTDLLIKHGSNVNAKDFLGNTPLHLAAENGKIVVNLNLKY